MEKNTGTDRIANVEIIAGVAIVAMVIAVVAFAVKKRKK
jgi:LPXTG-motif cell wall-anchored protein